MGITLFKDSADSQRTYYRITRAINGREQQRYVRVEGASKAALSRALKEAKDIDQRLAQWQTAVRQLVSMQGDALIHEDGTIVGLQLQTRHRDGRKPATEFKIRVKLPAKSPVFKSVSVDKHGFEQAFRLSVEKICTLRDISKEAEAYPKLLDCIAAYRDKYDVDTGPDAATERKGKPKPKKAAAKKLAAKAAVKEEEQDDESGWINQITGWLREEVDRFRKPDS